MTRDDVERDVRELGHFPGVDGCALVDADTGMVWVHGGDMQAIEQLGEAAIEFWRVQRRLASHFAPFGPLQSTAYSFADRVVALFPCLATPPLVLVCVARKKGIDWPRWGAAVAELKTKLASTARPAKASL